MAHKIIHPEWGARRPIRGILFDMDGLVLDTEKLYTRFWAEAGQACGFPMEKKHGLALRGVSRKPAQQMLHGFFGLHADYDTIRAKRIELMEAYLADHPIEAKPGIRELLDFLKEKGIATAITSSSPMENIRRHLTAQDLYHRFDKICSGHNVPNGKPAPDIYLLGAEVLGLKPEECLALEDAPAGIESAFRAGCLPVLIPDQDVPGEQTQVRCFAMADSLTDIINLLEQM